MFNADGFVLAGQKIVHIFMFNSYNDNVTFILQKKQYHCSNFACLQRDCN